MSVELGNGAKEVTFDVIMLKPLSCPIHMTGIRQLQFGPQNPVMSLLYSNCRGTQWLTGGPNSHQAHLPGTQPLYNNCSGAAF